ncbi:hypothetical protein GUITHDRAFT_103093 [Guillardia theta CCMP2712]|uniref:Uncharacterized protein n=1 Tax=Guillardia theta (strain CCMP2712) TaxID=905079 RepID=L1JRU1_GUITC|nr:hypothetical protein GUITHDRAFT_103093 [Guillardia theta CCMP2712]EKX51177.1 hypothetical protein GUITHDRAFT_103093 [Guillardia theta CCMP2712]|eukprot:XP_005838157.1 hypothetical protein GUITHDRAFT_103093 [Guillardia theta CCMP2712]
MASPVESENQTLPFDDGQSSNDAFGPPKCRPVGSRRFLSACMEEIEPIVQQRGKDTMYQCCYCGKWCTMSGTRALSKHIENDHRPQVIPVIRNGNGTLTQSMGLGETKYLFITFTPLESWNVQIEASLHFNSSDSEWATLRHLKKVSRPMVEESDAGRASLQLKMSSASPYLPRPVWDEKLHSKQRLSVEIFSEAEIEGRASGASAGFAVKISSGSCSTSSRQAELEISLKIHGKETSLILPLELKVETKIPSLRQVIPSGVMQLSSKEKAPVQSVEHREEGERCKRVADLCLDADDYTIAAGEGLYKRRKSDFQIASAIPLSTWPVLGLPNTDNSLQTLLLLSQLCQKSTGPDASIKSLPVLNASNLVNLSSAAVLSL